MVADLMITAEKAWTVNGMICMILSDKKEIRFPIHLNEKLRTAPEVHLKNIEIICGGTGLIGLIWMKIYQFQESW